VNTTAARRDFHVVMPFRAQLLLFEPGLAEYGVGVGVDQAGSEDASAAIDYFRIFECGPDVTRGPDRGDAAGAHGDRCVLQNARLAHLAPLPRAIGPGAGDDLRRVHEQEVLQNVFTRSAGH